MSTVRKTTSSLTGKKSDPNELYALTTTSPINGYEEIIDELSAETALFLKFEHERFGLECMIQKSTSLPF